MATRKIVVLGKEGGEVLSKKCKPVDKFDDRLAELIDRAGKKQVAEANGYFARVFFHELDHLDGILFVDKMLRDKKGRPYTYKDLKKGLIKDV